MYEVLKEAPAEAKFRPFIHSFAEKLLPQLNFVLFRKGKLSTFFHLIAAATVSKEMLKHPWVSFCLECIDLVLEPAY